MTAIKRARLVRVRNAVAGMQVDQTPSESPTLSKFGKGQFCNGEEIPVPTHDQGSGAGTTETPNKPVVCVMYRTRRSKRPTPTPVTRPPARATATTGLPEDQVTGAAACADPSGATRTAAKRTVSPTASESGPRSCRTAGTVEATGALGAVGGSNAGPPSSTHARSERPKSTTAEQTRKRIMASSGTREPTSRLAKEYGRAAGRKPAARLKRCGTSLRTLPAGAGRRHQRHLRPVRPQVQSTPIQARVHEQSEGH